MTKETWMIVGFMMVIMLVGVDLNKLMIIGTDSFNPTDFIILAIATMLATIILVFNNKKI